MISKALIGLTSSRIPNSDGLPAFAVNEPYARSVTAAGGIPIIIPLTLSKPDLDMLLQRVDGIIFTGGYDIDPQKYGHKPHPRVLKIDQDRDAVEIQLVQSVVEINKPFLGICRGLQVVNVAMGGSLYEHLPELSPRISQHDHHDKQRDYLAHMVKIEPGSQLITIFTSDEVQVNSLHHQGVRSLASNLRPTAYAPDGLIEAFELPEVKFGLAVQWHPEELQELETMRRLFQNFVKACHS